LLTLFGAYAFGVAAVVLADAGPPVEIRFDIAPRLTAIGSLP
jgi:hypothetical protein